MQERWGEVPARSSSSQRISRHLRISTGKVLTFLVTVLTLVLAVLTLVHSEDLKEPDEDDEEMLDASESQP